MRLCRIRFSWLVVTLLFCASALPAQQERARQYEFAIAKSSLPSGLGQLSKQTGLQIITQLNVSESETDEIGPFVGRASADEAFTALLKESDLSYAWQDEFTIIIFRREVRSPRSGDDVHEVE